MPGKECGSLRRQTAKRRSSAALENVWDPPQLVSPDPPPWTFNSPGSLPSPLKFARSGFEEGVSTSTARTVDDDASASSFESAVSTPRPSSVTLPTPSVMERQVQDLEDELLRLREESEQLTTTNADLEESACDHIHAIAELRSQYDQAADALADIHDQIAHANSALADLNLYIDASRSSRDALTNEVREAQEQLKKVNHNLLGAESAIEDRHSRLFMLEHSSASVSHELDAKRTQLQQSMNTCEQEQARLFNLQREVSGSTQALTRAQSELSQFATRSKEEEETVQGRLSRLKADIHSAQELMKSQKKEQQEDSIRRDREIKVLSSILTTLVPNTTLLQDTLAREQSHLDDLKRASIREKAFLDTVSARKQQAEQAAGVTEIHASRLRDEVTHSQEELERLKSAIREATSILEQTKRSAIRENHEQTHLSEPTSNHQQATSAVRIDRNMGVRQRLAQVVGMSVIADHEVSLNLS